MKTCQENGLVYLTLDLWKLMSDNECIMVWRIIEVYTVEVISLSLCVTPST